MVGRDEEKQETARDVALGILFYVFHFIFVQESWRPSFLSSPLRHEIVLILLCCVLFSHAIDLSCISRDFQFGHMDGNDYINSLIMG